MSKRTIRGIGKTTSSSDGNGQHAGVEARSRVTKRETSRAGARQKSSFLKRARRWLQLSVAAILIAAGFAFYLHWRAAGQTHSGKGGTPPIMISTVAASRGDIGVYVKALGTVTPINTVSVTARVAGQIAKVEYQEGQLVHVGDPLVDIDPAPFQAAVTQAEGQLARDQAQLELAKLNLDRDSDLLKKGVISKQEFDTASANNGLNEGAVKLDQGNLDQAKVNLAYCHITSPINGRAGLRMVDTGNIVQANGTTPLVVITQLQPITVEFNVAEDAVPQIMQAINGGRQPEVDAYDRADQKKLATGKVESFNSQIDATTGTLKLRATFQNDDSSLFPNQFVNARLLVDTHQGITLLPSNAIQRNDGGVFVYLVQSNQTVALKTITVGTTEGNVTEVQGLEPAAVVAADSFNRLTDGAKVAVRPPASPAASPQPAR
ncbi:MAG: rane fusion protein multidrug efflux system [Verrucomicrobiota bacterium]|jgi:multidrug efflux system membrane fusion protein